MVHKENPHKKYVVCLSVDERAFLDQFLRGGRRSAELVTRARILLKADVSEAGDGWSDSRIAEALDTSKNNVMRTRQRLVELGFEASHGAAVQSRFRPPQGVRRRGGGAADRPRLPRRRPRATPSGRCASWKRRSSQLDIVPSASDNTIGRNFEKKRPQATPEETVGHSSGRQRRLRRLHGGRAGGLRASTRPESSLSSASTRRRNN